MRTLGPMIQPVTVDRTEDLGATISAMGLAGSQPVVLLIGGAAGLDAAASEHLLPFVTEGVVATAERAGAAIVDGGTDAGVMALAGRAYEQLGPSIPLIGVAPRGRVAAPGIAEATGDTPLEPHHSHQLLVPGDRWGAEGPWLVGLARLLASGQPIVAVLIEGGPLALSEALECAGQGWPVIALAGSGRSADLLAGYARGGGGQGVSAADRSGIHVSEVAAGPSALAAVLYSLLTREEGAVEDVRAAVRSISSRDYPALYFAASEAAKVGQTSYKRLVLAELVLTITGLTIALVASLGPANLLAAVGLTSGTLLVVASAIPFLAALVLKFINRSSGYAEDWFNGRALAETVKSLAWRYMMRVSPYANADGDQRFTSDLAGILRRGAEFRQAVERLPEGAGQISQAMRSVRDLELTDRRDYYVARRLLDQAEWYRRKSAASRRAASRWFWWSVVFQLGAATVALLSLAGGGDSILGLMTLFGSVAIAMTAWTQLNRHDELGKSYALALQELLLISAPAGQADTEEALESLVREGEEAVAREHRLWVAKRSEGIEMPQAGEGG